MRACRGCWNWPESATATSRGRWRRRYGITPVGFINRERLAHAAVLLATTTDAVGRIAERCGFTSQSYFGRRFREQHQQTPREYREQARRAVVP